MGTNSNLTGVSLAAALAEVVYGRNLNDMPMSLTTQSGLGVTNFSDQSLGNLGFQTATLGSPVVGNPMLYYNARGFGAMVVQKDGKIYVVFRGTDAAGSFAAGFYKGALASTTTPGSDAPSYQHDIGDFANNIDIGSQGTTSVSQIDDALALVRAVKLAAGTNEVVVVGQSLGGGLAGVVGAVEGLTTYAIAPAPFAGQLAIEATFKALDLAGISRGMAQGLPTGITHATLGYISRESAFYIGGDALKAYLLPTTGLSASQVDAIVANQILLKAAYVAATHTPSFHVDLITGESMNDGIGQIAAWTLATRFDATHRYDVGETVSVTGGAFSNTAISLHSPSLHALVIRTDADNDLALGKSFAELLRSDKALRLSLLENLGVAGPLDGARDVGTSTDHLGGSAVASSGPSPAILYRALWSTVGDNNGLYSYFFDVFKNTLQKGIAGGLNGSDVSGTTDLGLTLHSGLMKLSLGVLRDALQNAPSIDVLMQRPGASSTSPAAAFAGNDAANGGSATALKAFTDRVVIDRTLIHATDPLLKDLPSGATISREFGARDVENAVWLAFFSSLGNGFIGTITSSILGVTAQAISEGKGQLKQWDVVVAQAGLDTGTLYYDPAVHSANKWTFAQGSIPGGTPALYKDAAHIIFGGDYDPGRGSAIQDDLTGSSKDDYIVGNKGNDRLQGRAGRDILIGGDGSDTASYRDAASKIDIENAIDMSPTRDAEAAAGIIRMKVDGDGTAVDTNGTVDILAGIERIELTRFRDVFALTTNSTIAQFASKLPSGLIIDGGKSDKDASGNILTPDPSLADATKADKLDLSAAAPATGTTGVLIAASSDGSRSVEVYSELAKTSQSYALVYNMLVPTGVPVTSGTDKGTGLRFAGFEEIVGTAKDDVLGLHRMNPGAEFTAADQTLLRQIEAQTISADPNQPYTIKQAYEGLVTAAGAILANKQQVIVDGGAGKDFIVGTSTGQDVIYGGAGNDTLVAGGYVTKAYGGSGSDILYANGFRSELWGGDGIAQDNEADIFHLTANATAKDAGFEDYATFGASRLTGGVAQWWQEGKWAYWMPISSLMNISPITFLGPLGVVGITLDTSQNLIRYGLSSANELIVQVARGRGGQATINNFKNVNDQGQSTAHIVIAKQNGPATSYDQIVDSIDLALRAGFGNCIKGTDPLILDLDGDGVELIRQDAASIYFDIDSDGFAERTAWVASDDGILARDLNANGTIDNIGELFGNATTPGLTALKTLDTNADNKITAADAGFGTLRIWRDLNGNGVTDAGELQTLAQAGITEISVVSGTPTSTSINGNTIRAQSTFVVNGSTRTVVDALLDNSQTDSRYLGNGTISAGAAALPALKGYGNLTDLRVAMTQDATLLTKVTTFKNLAATSSWSALEASATDVLYRWAGVDTVAATALTDKFDARKLAFLEKQAGYQLMQRDAGGNPILNNVAQMVTLWDQAVDMATIRLAAQGPWTSVLPGITFDLTSDRLLASASNTLSDAFKQMFTKLSATASVAETQWKTDWAPAVAALTAALTRADGNDVKADFTVSRLVHAMDTQAVSLSLQQLVDGLALPNMHIGATAAEALDRGTASGLHVYVGGAGNDTLNGGSGQDAYVYGRNFGQDTISDVEAIGTQSGDRIRFAVHNAADVTMVRVGIDLVISVNGTTDKITVKNYFETPTRMASGLQISNNWGVEEIQFADGSIWEAGDIAAAVGRGTNGNDTIDGSGIADDIEGLKGDDLLRGGDGSDIYYYAPGDGNDTISDVMTNPLLQASDALVMTGGITMEDLRFARTGKSNDVTISFTSGGSITLKDQFAYNALGFRTNYATDSRIEMFVFSMGEPWSWMDLQGAVISTYTTSGNDTTYGFGTPDEFYASAGNDFLQGLDGGDLYAFGRGMGQDTIDDGAQFIDTFVSGLVGYSWGANDILTLQGLNQTDVTFSRVGAAPDLLISINGTTDTLLIKGQFQGIKLDLFNLLGVAWFNRVEEFKFADGSKLTWEDILRKITTGDAADNTLYGAFYADTIDGKGGADYLSGGDEGDTYLFGRGYGSDTIEDKRTNVLVTADDTVQFGANVLPTDVVFRRDGTTNDLLITIVGTSDTLRIKNQYVVSETGVFGPQGYDEIEKFVFANGTIKTWATLRQEIITASKTAGNDTIYGSHYNDTMDGGGGNDLLYGGNGSDTYLFGRTSGQDVAEDISTNLLAPGMDRVLVAADVLPTDVTVLRGANEDLILKINGTTNTLTLKGTFNYSNIGWKPNEIETVAFANGTIWTRNDLITKALASQNTSANDTIRGFFSDDTITAGLGNDTLQGGDGADTYIFARGNGQDVIQESINQVFYSDDDTLQLASGILTTDVTLSRSADLRDLIVSINGSTDKMTVAGQFVSWGFSGSSTDVERIKFADGTIWTAEQIRQKLLAQVSTAGNDTISGFYTADIIDGGAGNDLLKGSTGADTYLFGRGSGQDTITESVDDHVFLDGADTVVFGAAIVRADVTFSRVGNDLIVTIAGATDKLTITSHFTGAFSKIEFFKFADGTTLTAAQAEANVLAASSTSGNDNMVGTSIAELFDGGAGNDTMSGVGGGDTYMFGRGYGSDTINENGDLLATPEDRVVFKAGVSLGDLAFSRAGNNLVIKINGTTDQLTVVNQFNAGNFYGHKPYRIEKFIFADGTALTDADVGIRVLQSAITIGNDSITGYDTADTLDGGAGNDTLNGTAGADTYLFGRGSGSDKIAEVGDGGPEIVDRVTFGAGVTLADLRLSRVNNDLVININGTTDQLTIQTQFAARSFFGDQFNRIESFELADGSALTHEEIALRVLQAATTIGNDTITAYDTDDTLDGGAGNDTLTGKTGSDTYVFGRGYGIDSISETGDYSYNAPADRVLFKSGLAKSDFILSRSGNDLVMSVAGSADQLRVVGQFAQLRDGYSTTNRIETFEFADGTTWTQWEVDAIVLQNQQTAGNDTITAYDLSETLDGGTGNDTLIGKTGADTYLFGRGAGVDSVNEQGDYSYNAPTDRVLFKAGITKDDLVLSRSGNDLVMTVAGTTDQLRVIGQFTQLRDGYSTTNRIEFFEFADGSRWTQWEVDALVLQAQQTPGNDTVTAYDLDETLDGGPGNDTLIGMTGADTYMFGRASGQDRIQETGDGSYGGIDDRVVFKTGVSPTDVSFSRSGNDLVVKINGTTDQLSVVGYFTTLGTTNLQRIERFEFTDGTVWLAPEIDLKVLAGMTTPGADTVTGGDLDDVMSGGTGADTLLGKEGNDTYLFKTGNGNDTISDGVGTTSTFDRLKLINVTTSGVTLAKSVNDLKVTITSTGEIITVQNHFASTTVNNGVEAIEFADGTAWDLPRINAIVNGTALTLGTGGNDTYAGSAAADSYSGEIGNDVISGGDGNDLLLGGNGNDTIDGGNGADTIWAGDGNDTVNFSSPVAGTVDRMIGGFGVDTISLANHSTAATIDLRPFGVVLRRDTSAKIADLEGFEDAVGSAFGDLFYGNLNENVLRGGGGADTLIGGAASDTYVYASGDGNDNIQDSGGRVADLDRLSLVNLNVADLTFQKSGNGLLVKTTATGHTINVTDQFHPDRYWGLEVIQFADGTTWNLDRINASVITTGTSFGTASADTSAGTTSNDIIFGEAGNDTISGAAGNDTLGGGNGADQLNGGAGTDVLYGDSGDDTLFVTSSVVGELDRLFGGDGVDTASFAGFGSAVLIDIDVPTFADYPGPFDLVEARTRDGATLTSGVWRSVAHLSGIENVTGTDLADQIFGSAVNNILGGGAGNDALDGRAGADALDGGTGNDTLTGGAGNDTFSFATGFGLDTITDFTAGAGATDVLRLSLGTAFDTYAEVMAVASQSGANTVITFNPTTTITLLNVTKTAIVADDFAFF